MAEIVYFAHLEEEVKTKETHAGIERKHGGILHLYSVHILLAIFL